MDPDSSFAHNQNQLILKFYLPVIVINAAAAWPLVDPGFSETIWTQSLPLGLLVQGSRGLCNDGSERMTLTLNRGAQG